MPSDFMGMSWADWQRAAQGYIIRNARYLDGARKIAYFALLAAGAKRIKEKKLFRIATDPVINTPKVTEAEKITKEQADYLLDLYFNKKFKNGKAWQQPKRV